MAGRPGPATLFAKWVVIPIVVAFAGYLVVGPRIGKIADKATKSDPTPGDAPRIGHSENGDTSVVDEPAPTEKTSHQVRKKSSPEPDLDISVKSDRSDSVENTPARGSAAADATPAANAPATDSPVKPAVHRRHRPVPKPAPKQPTDDANTPVVIQNGDSGQGDQGGSAGSTTAGGG